MSQQAQGGQPPNTPSFQIPEYVLDDLCSRFIINIPEEERQDLIRVFFQIELAHWFYLDFYCAENPELKTCGIKDFSAQIFYHCPSLSVHVQEVDKILGNWKSYKMSVPTYGAIMLDPDRKYCLLVQGFWAKASWGFPKGKVNANEQPSECAIREVFEETGFDVSKKLKKELFLENKMNDQLTRLYIIENVPLDTKFQPKTRKEIKSLQWFPLEFLPSHKRDQVSKTHLGLNPNTFFMVIPFVKQIRKWVSSNHGNRHHSHSTHVQQAAGAMGGHSPAAGRLHTSSSDVSLHSNHSNTGSHGNTGSHSNTYSTNHDMSSHGNNPHASNSHPKTSKELDNLNNVSRQYRDKQKQRQQQYFSNGNQNEWQEFMQFKDSKTRARDARERKQQQKTETDKQRPPQQQQQPQQSYPSPNFKSDKKQKQHFQILNRDGSVGKPRRSLATQFDNQGAVPLATPPHVKYGNTKPDRRQKKQENTGPVTIENFVPSSWRNFKFDTEAIMACF